MNAIVEQKAGANALAQVQPTSRMAVAEIIGHVAMVQEVMRAVMKQDVHYGVIPGTDKPTLLKAGAEVLCMAFRIADTYSVEDLSTENTVRYRVTCTGTHQVLGHVLGTGMGEASSGEEKYKWRKANSAQEYDETPANLRREKHGFNRAKKEKFTVQQVRTEPADLANTVLKMANKRAKMAMVLNVTAASDCFSQDLEDMDDALRDHLTRHGDDGQAEAQQQHPGPQPWPDDKLDERKAKVSEWQKAGKTADEVITFLSAKGLLSDAQKARIRSWFTPASNAAAPTVSYDDLVARLNKLDASDAETAGLILDEGRVLPPEQLDALTKLHDTKFPQE